MRTKISTTFHVTDHFPATLKPGETEALYRHLKGKYPADINPFRKRSKPVQQTQATN